MAASLFSHIPKAIRLHIYSAYYTFLMPRWQPTSRNLDTFLDSKYKHTGVWRNGTIIWQSTRCKHFSVINLMQDGNNLGNLMAAHPVYQP